MSDIMTPISFDKLVNWILEEHKKYGTVFGEKHAYVADRKYNRSIFGRSLETPIGPAAGTEYTAYTKYCGSILYRKPFL